jgi:hypothetical protein
VGSREVKLTFVTPTYTVVKNEKKIMRFAAESIPYIQRTLYMHLFVNCISKL